MKNIASIIREGDSHWVGDGFPVRTMFTYNTSELDISPFLLLDYAGPHEFTPSTVPRGVGKHPHRGFETVTIVYQGELEHQDTAGNAGRIGPGDVQWMTAGRGVLHEEMHSGAFTREGGSLEAIQLWVNLPSTLKMTEPAYQEIQDQMIPVVTLENDAGQVRVIAGEFSGSSGPARSFTPINLWDIQLNASGNVSITLPSGYTTAVFVLDGLVQVNKQESIGAIQLLGFEREGNEISLQAIENTRLLLMNGKPIDEPLTGYGPFVMNSEREIRQAIDDFKHGRF